MTIHDSATIETRYGNMFRLSNSNLKLAHIELQYTFVPLHPVYETFIIILYAGGSACPAYWPKFLNSIETIVLHEYCGLNTNLSVQDRIHND